MEKMVVECYWALKLHKLIKDRLELLSLKERLVN